MIIISAFHQAPKLSTAQKKLAAVDKTGMKSIASFFGKASTGKTSGKAKPKAVAKPKKMK